MSISTRRVTLLVLLWLFDVIKQNESELENNESQVFNLTAIFCWNHHQNWMYGPRDIQLWSRQARTTPFNSEVRQELFCIQNFAVIHYIFASSSPHNICTVWQNMGFLLIKMLCLWGVSMYQYLTKMMSYGHLLCSRLRISYCFSGFFQLKKSLTKVVRDKFFWQHTRLEKQKQGFWMKCDSYVAITMQNKITKTKM